MASEFESTAPLRTELRELEGLADSFGRAMTTAFRRSVVDGKQLDDVLRSLALSLSSRALSSALAPIGQGIGSLFSGLFGGARFGGGAALSGAASLSSGGAMSPARSAAPSGASAGRGGLKVVFNVTTPDAQSFRRAEGEVAAMLARAVARGQRGL